jgi:hypothetical protein
MEVILMKPSKIIQFLVDLSRFLCNVERFGRRLGPARLFNILKTPQLLSAMLQAVESMVGAFFFLLFWALLVFWLSRWGSFCFWISIVLQLIFIGFPEFLVIYSEGPQQAVVSLLQPSHTWPLWIFLAGIILEILEWFRFGRGEPPNGDGMAR